MEISGGISDAEDEEECNEAEADLVDPGDAARGGFSGGGLLQEG